METQSGHFYLVSVGIGDPDNMTIRARKIIEAADIVFAMKFIRTQLAFLLEGKEVHDAGHGLFSKMTKNTAMIEEEKRIPPIIRSAVAAGKTVVVLDFGDPTLYSPQSGYLTEFADLSPQIIPGISCFNAANAALGREITGAYDHAVILTEAMCGWEGSKERLAKLAATQSTLVFFAMRMDLDEVVGELKNHYAPDTPVAIVAHAGFSDKETVYNASLETVARLASQEKLSWDHLIYVGDFLRLAHRSDFKANA